MQQYKNLFLFACILASLLSASEAMAQRRVVQLEGYFYGVDHRAFILNSSLSCDSLGIKDKYGKTPPADELICYVAEYTGESDFSIYQRDGVMLCIDSNGQFYSKDLYGSFPPYYLNIKLDDLIGGRSDMVLEVDDYDYDSLVVKAFALKDYVLGKKSMSGTVRTSIYYNNFTYPAKGEISPEVLDAMRTGTYILPEDGKIDDEFTLFLPVDKAPFKGQWSFYIYDLSGNIIKMMTGLNAKENVLKKENITPGTYRYAIFFNGKTEIKKGMIFFKRAVRPE